MYWSAQIDLKLATQRKIFVYRCGLSCCFCVVFVFNLSLFRYNQAVAMTRFYKRPILLIEFDPNKSFSLQVSVPKGDVTLGIFSHSLLYVP